MPLFTSDRERQLWISALAVVVAIFSTLGLASLLAPSLYNQGISAVVFLGCMFLVALTIFIQGLSIKPGGIEIGVGVAIAVVYILVLLRLTLPERSHLIEYGILAILIHEALAERKRQGRRVLWPPFLAVLAASLIGVIDESIQLVVPRRLFQWSDMLFNFLAATMANDWSCRSCLGTTIHKSKAVWSKLSSEYQRTVACLPNSRTLHVKPQFLGHFRS